MADATDFKKVNARGAVTYSQFTMNQALAQNERSKFKKKDLAEVAPEVQLLLDDTQLKKLVKHITDVFLPECVRRHNAGEKKEVLDPKQAKKVEKALTSGPAENWAVAPPHLPIKPVYKKTLKVIQWPVGTLKITGTKGRDIEQLARVNGESELKVPDPDLLAFPVLRPINDTVHELYPGAWAYATLNLHAWEQSATNWGISAYANTVVFLEDRDRLGGGFGLDEEDVFMDK